MGRDRSTGLFNLSELEGRVCALAGTALLALGLTHRRAGRVFFLVPAAILIARSVDRHCPVFHALGIDHSGRPLR